MQPLRIRATVQFVIRQFPTDLSFFCLPLQRLRTGHINRAGVNIPGLQPLSCSSHLVVAIMLVHAHAVLDDEEQVDSTQSHESLPHSVKLCGQIRAAVVLLAVVVLPLGLEREQALKVLLISGLDKITPKIH